jgi:hypothetical protein
VVCLDLGFLALSYLDRYFCPPFRLRVRLFLVLYIHIRKVGAVGIWNREENQVKTAKSDHERRSKHTYSARIYAGKACVFR